MSPRHDVAADFRISLRAAMARGELPQGVVTKAEADGELLVVLIQFMPPGSYNPSWLTEAAPTGHMLNAQGLRVYDRVSQLAVEAAARGAPDMMAAILHHPDALASARAQLAEAA